jgi:hypothetical protein
MCERVREGLLIQVWSPYTERYKPCSDVQALMHAMVRSCSGMVRVSTV